MDPQTVAIGVGVALKVGGMALGLGASKKAKKANKLRREAALVASFLERRAAIQQFNLAKAQTIAGSLASGAGIESSGVQGSVASAGSQVRSNLSYNAWQVINEKRASKLAGKAQQRSDLGGIVGDAGGLVMGLGSSGLLGGGGSGYSASEQRAGTGSFVSASRPLPVGGPLSTGYGGAISVRPPTTIPIAINSSAFI